MEMASRIGRSINVTPATLTGLDMGKGMKEAMNRLEAGEDPEKIEEEMGDILEEDPFALPEKKVAREKNNAPCKDETLYEL